MRPLNLLVNIVIMLASIFVTQTVYALQIPKIIPNSPPIQKQAQIQEEEKDELKDCLSKNKALLEELNTVKVSRDMARQETNSIRKELEQIKNIMAENQGSIDVLLNDLKNTKKELAEALVTKGALLKAIEEANQKIKTSINAGDLVIITPEIIPACPINLNRITPKIKGSYGVVVVNVLINENGEVLDTKLLQGLPGTSESVNKANAICVEQAKRLIFDPAKTAYDKIKVRVWQGVGFFLN